MSTFLVTTLIAAGKTGTTGRRRTEIWDGKQPLGLGHPFRWILEKTSGGLRLRELGTTLGRIEKLRLENYQTENFPATGTSIELGTGISLHIRPVNRDLSKAVKWTSSPAGMDLDSEGSRWFIRSFRHAVVGLGAFVMMTLLWPAPKVTEKELVPEQFTRIVLTQPVRPAPAQASGGTPAVAGAAQAVQKKVEKTAVVQAFRAKALQNAVSGLLKGGMTALLAQSDFVRGQQANAGAKRIFNSKSDSMQATAFTVGDVTNRQILVASLGGEGISDMGKKGVGYKSGDRAGVDGQGKGHLKIKAEISGDTLGANVQEGLTKDEVGEIIHRHMSEIRYCYESAMLRSQDVEGKLIVDFTIGAIGAVKTTAVKTSTLPDPRLDDCILRRLVTWKFPLPKGGIDVAVTYPFIFKTLGR